VRNQSSEMERASGLAALSICESLLTSLQELRIIGEQEIAGILKDASAAHHQASAADNSTAHRDAAAVIDRLIIGKNSIRHL
jgi:hypothetical protein